MENFSVMTSFKKQQLKKSVYIRLLPLSFVAPFFFVLKSDDQFVSKIFYSFLLKSLCHFPLGIAHYLFSFQRTSYDLLKGEIMASHFEEEMDATFQISVVSVFRAPEGGPVGIFKDFKIQFPVRLVAENIFSSSFEKKTETKTLAGKSREIFCVLSSKQRFAMRTKLRTSGPRIPQGIFCWLKAKILLHGE